jgi:hypothetical protein
VLVLPPSVEDVPPLAVPLFESSLDEQPLTTVTMPAVQSNPNQPNKPRSVIPGAYRLAPTARWLFLVSAIFMRAECDARLHARFRSQ